jgi:ribonuclease Z
MSARRFEVTTLGTGAALPARGRHPSAQLLNIHEGLYLLDCGEGTQERLRAISVNFMRIGHILISHLHGDHYLGLQGLIGSMHLMGRLQPLHIHGPALLKEIIDLQLRASGTYLRYPLQFHALEPVNGLVVHSDERVTIRSLALRHRIPCTGFVFHEVQATRQLRRETLHLVPHFKRQSVKQGDDLVLPDGTVYPNGSLTFDPPAPRSYAYCSDTAYAPELVPYITGVDLLYHEATFTQQLKARAKETQHSTAEQAARMAQQAQVGRLLLGHFSSRYKEVDALLAEARAHFPNTEASAEGCTYAIPERTGVENL